MQRSSGYCIALQKMLMGTLLNESADGQEYVTLCCSPWARAPGVTGAFKLTLIPICCQVTAGHDTIYAPFLHSCLCEVTTAGTPHNNIDS